VETGQSLFLNPPPEGDAAERGRRLFTQACDFAAGAESEDRIPPPGLPEIAFAGRSNVGKSSLVNALTGRKTLARVSHTPGRTQQINFFDLAGQLILVDLPGYGYAEVSKSKQRNWGRLIKDYLRGRPCLRCVYLLIDGRHGLKGLDRELMRLLDESAVAYRIVLTKTDETKPAELAAVIARTAETLKSHTAAFPLLFATSSHTGAGIEDLRAEIARQAG
jgi:GTP-binding protein